MAVKMGATIPFPLMASLQSAPNQTKNQRPEVKCTYAGNGLTCDDVTVIIVKDVPKGNVRQSKIGLSCIPVSFPKLHIRDFCMIFHFLESLR